jgi:hypothetical protein
MQTRCDTHSHAERGCIFAALRESLLLGFLLLLLLITLSPRVLAEPLNSIPQSQTVDEASEEGGAHQPIRKLIVIGFMGGNVHATNLIHREAQLIQSLQQGYPLAIHAAIFAAWPAAFRDLRAPWRSLRCLPSACRGHAVFGVHLVEGGLVDGDLLDVQLLRLLRVELARQIAFGRCRARRAAWERWSAGRSRPVLDLADVAEARAHDHVL